MMINSSIRDYERDILAITNVTNIPIEAKRLVLGNVLRAVEIAANEMIEKERKEVIDESGKD